MNHLCRQATARNNHRKDIHKTNLSPSRYVLRALRSNRTFYYDAIKSHFRYVRKIDTIPVDFHPTFRAKSVLVRTPVIGPISGDHITAHIFAASRAAEKPWMRNATVANNRGIRAMR